MEKDLKVVNPISELSTYLQTDPKELTEVLKKTAFKNCTKDEDFKACVMVANTYKLNPILKQIYAFPGKGGGIVPVVSVDGWIKIVTSNKNYNGVEFEDIRDNSNKLIAITCKISIKGQDHPTCVTEYLSECEDKTKPTWQKWPYRMLRHKAYIQCARMAFGYAGIYDEDEAERIDSVTEIQAGKPDVEMPKEKVIETEVVEKEPKAKKVVEEPKKEEVKQEEVIEEPKEKVIETKTLAELKATDSGNMVVKAFVKKTEIAQTKTGKDFTKITVIDSYETENPVSLVVNAWGKKELDDGCEYIFIVEIKKVQKADKTFKNYLATEIKEI